MTPKFSRRSLGETWKLCYSTPMINYLIIAAMAATVLVVLIGVLNMGRQGENSGRFSNILMRWRIALQAIAIALIMISLWLGTSGA